MHKFLDGKGHGLYRIPPFRDAHMHFMIDGRPASLQDVSGIGELYAKVGIFSVSDMGHRTGLGIDAKAHLAGKIAVRTAGNALCKKGSYGEFLGKGVSGKEQIKRAVKELADAGADFIKVINSGVVSFRSIAPVTAGGFTPEELKIIHSEARESNLDIVCHANSDSAIRDAVVAGTASIEHGFFVSLETLHMMTESKVSWTPTIFALSVRTASLATSEKRYVEGIIEDHLVSVSNAASLGIRLKTGTDSGSRGVNHGVSFFEELRFFRKAGLTEGQILSSACMDISEIEKGNYLLINEDFVESGIVDEVYGNGKRIFPQ
jgi:imidazolonepropionase-like amidohydrolase